MKKERGSSSWPRKGFAMQMGQSGRVSVGPKQTINIRSELYRPTSHIQDLTLETVETDWLLCEQKEGLAAFNAKGKMKGHLNL